jgi:hypothetical protein
VAKTMAKDQESSPCVRRQARKSCPVLPGEPIASPQVHGLLAMIVGL